MKPQIVVVGSFVQDLTWRCAAFPKAGETIVGHFVTGPGGKGSNQAIAAGRMGVPTHFIGAVGADAFGKEAKAFYKAEGIGATFVVKPRHATGTAGILVNDRGENEIVVALGANAHLARADVPDALLTSARVVVTQLESTLATTADVLKRARRAQALTVLNPAPMRPEFDLKTLRYVDVLIPNETEFAALLRRLPATADFTETTLAGLSAEAMHALCRSLGVPTVIVTLGARGCFVSQAGGGIFLPAHTGIRVVDTTGAGDAFVGGFAAGYQLSGGNLLHAARFATMVAALSVTKVGTAPAMPTGQEISRFRRQLGAK